MSSRLAWRSWLGLAVVAIGVGCRDPSEDASPSAEEASPMVEPSDAWATHTSKACAFSIELPLRRSPQPTPMGLLDQIAAEDRVAGYLASCADVPSVGSAEEFLEISSQAIVGQLGGSVQSRTPMKIQGRPAMEIDSRIAAANKPPGVPWPGDLRHRLRLIVAGRRQYQVHVLYAADATERIAPTMDRFFASFRLLDDAPAAAAPPTWDTHLVAHGTLQVEAPGKPAPMTTSESPAPDHPPDPPSGLVEALRFVNETGGSDYLMSVWQIDLPAKLDTPAKRLRAHFVLRVVSEHTEVVSEAAATVAGLPALDVVYHPNLPMPEHLEPDDPQVRQALETVLETKKSTFRMRLVEVDDRIVQLLATDDRDPEGAARFLDSLKVVGAAPPVETDEADEPTSPE